MGGLVILVSVVWFWCSWFCMVLFEVWVGLNLLFVVGLLWIAVAAI